MAAVPVAVAAGHADGPDEGGGEPPGSFLHGGIHFRLLVSLRDFCVDAAYRRETRRGNNIFIINMLRELYESPRHTQNPRLSQPQRGIAPTPPTCRGRTSRSEENPSVSERARC